MGSIERYKLKYAVFRSVYFTKKSKNCIMNETE